MRNSKTVFSSEDDNASSPAVLEISPIAFGDAAGDPSVVGNLTLPLYYFLVSKCPFLLTWSLLVLQQRRVLC